MRPLLKALLALFLSLSPCLASFEIRVEADVISPLLTGIAISNHAKDGGTRHVVVEHVVTDGKNLPRVRRYFISCEKGNSYAVLGTYVKQSSTEPCLALKGKIGWALRVTGAGGVIHHTGGNLINEFSKAQPTIWNGQGTVWRLELQTIPTKQLKCHNCNGIGQVTAIKGDSFPDDVRTGKQACPDCNGKRTSAVRDWAGLVESSRKEKLAYDAAIAKAAKDAASATAAIAAADTEAKPSTKEDASEWDAFLKEEAPAK
jgi:hypothetical protein